MLLELALRNLLDNALAHTPRGTAIEVQLNADERWLQVCDDGARQRAQGLDGGPAAAAEGASGHALGLGLGHRVVDKVAAVHGGRFASLAPPPGFSTCYRISFT